jgi:hypothetical protein
MAVTPEEAAHQETEFVEDGEVDRDDLSEVQGVAVSGSGNDVLASFGAANSLNGGSGRDGCTRANASDTLTSCEIR